MRRTAYISAQKQKGVGRSDLNVLRNLSPLYGHLDENVMKMNSPLMSMSGSKNLARGYPMSPTHT